MTSFENVIDRSTSLFVDYRLDNVYNTNREAFEIFMRSQLLNSIDDFSTSCLSDLSYHKEIENEIEKYYFDGDLTGKEISILAKGIVINWMTRNILDVEQMNLHLSNRDFKAYSEANNLKMKQETLDKLKEDYSRDIENYQLGSLDTLPYFNGK